MRLSNGGFRCVGEEADNEGKRKGDSQEREGRRKKGGLVGLDRWHHVICPHVKGWME